MDELNKRPLFNIRKNIFACLFSVHNTISLSCHEQVCLMRLRFERYFSQLIVLKHYLIHRNTRKNCFQQFSPITASTTLLLWSLSSRLININKSKRLQESF